MFTPREGAVRRKTNETDVSVRLNLDGSGHFQNRTSVGFLDHMLDLFARHGGFDLEITCEGDLQVDDHHTVEEVGITLASGACTSAGRQGLYWALWPCTGTDGRGTGAFGY